MIFSKFSFHSPSKGRAVGLAAVVSNRAVSTVAVQSAVGRGARRTKSTGTPSRPNVCKKMERVGFQPSREAFASKVLNTRWCGTKKRRKSSSMEMGRPSTSPNRNSPYWHEFFRSAAMSKRCRQTSGGTRRPAECTCASLSLNLLHSQSTPTPSAAAARLTTAAFGADPRYCLKAFRETGAGSSSFFVAGTAAPVNSSSSLLPTSPPT